MSARSHWSVVRGRPMHALVADPDPRRQRDRAWQSPIVMAHGLGVAAQSLRSLGEEMADLGYRALIPDQPGFGLSTGRHQPPPLDISRLADAVAAWMAVAGIERAAVFGNSVGGQVAADLAARHAERTAAVVLVGPTIDPAARSVAAQAVRWLRNLPRDGASFGPGLVGAYRRAGLRRIARTAQYAVRDRIETKLPRISAPALVVAGEIDPIAPLPWVRRVCQGLPAGDLVVIEGAGHSMEGLRPGALASEMSAFLEAIARGEQPRGCTAD